VTDAEHALQQCHEAFEEHHMPCRSANASRAILPSLHRAVSVEAILAIHNYMPL
jgi:hypothetical protein